MSLRLASPRAVAPMRRPTAAANRAPGPVQFAAAPVLQLRRKKRRRANARLADAVMGRMGVGRDTTSPVGAVAGAFLSKGLRGAMGESGSLRNMLMGRAMDTAADRIAGRKGGEERPSLGALIAGHFKDSLAQRLATSDLGRAYGMAKGPWQEASRRRDIAKQRAAGGSVVAARAARRAAADPEETPSLGGLFGEPGESGEPPAPQILPRPAEPKPDITPNTPLMPVSVTTGLATRSATQGAGDRDDDEEGRDP